MKKSSKIILGIIAIMLLIGIAVGVYCFARNKNVSNAKGEELEEKSSNSSKVDIANENNESTIIDVEPKEKDDEITSDKALYIYSSGDNKNQNVADNSNENKPDDNKLNVNGSYKYENQTDNYYHRSNIVITNQTDTSINFSINAAHGNDVDHVNVGEVSGTANKIDIPTDSVVAESEQIAYQYTENIDGNVNKITFICTAHRQFQYIEVTEEYPSGMNPYAGNRVYFSGEYDKIN